MGELLVGVALAALSGITFLAYKHPKAYEQLFVALIPILIAVEIWASAWDSSNTNAHKVALPYVVPEKLSEASNAITGEAIWKSDPYFWYILIGLTFYIIFLRFVFPLWFGENKVAKEEKRKQ